MALRHDQQVHRSLGRDVREGDDLVVLEEQAGRDLAGDDAAEEAVRVHARSLPRIASRHRRRWRRRRRLRRATLAPSALSFASIAS